MVIKFAELEIFLNDGGGISLMQPMYGEEDQVIAFPLHQAAAISKAIMSLAKET